MNLTVKDEAPLWFSGFLFAFLLLFLKACGRLLPSDEGRWMLPVKALQEELTGVGTGYIHSTFDSTSVKATERMVRCV